MDVRSFGRRHFFKVTVAATAVATGFPYIIPYSAFGADGAIAPSNRLALGVISCGSQGTNNLRGFLAHKNEVQVVAVCDVDREHRLAAKNLVDRAYKNADCAEYNDFRDLLARKDLDIVSIAVPDHWHSIPAIWAAQTGLDIYAEKPLALTISEGRAMRDAVQQHDRIWQTGSWQRSQSHFRFACELVRNGRIGNVHTVEVGLPTGPKCKPQPIMPIPDGLDYDMWLGPAPYAPYTEKRCHWDFRWILDYSGGQLTDWGAHHCDIANWGMGTEHTGPVEVAGSGVFPREGLWNAATDYRFTCKYAPAASSDVGRESFPTHPDGFVMDVSNQHKAGIKWIGADGWVWVDRGGIETFPKTLMQSRIGANEIRLYRSEDHIANFLECVRTRKTTVAPIEAAQRAISIAHIGNIAMQCGRKIRWNPETEQILNDPEASLKLSRTMRSPWHI